MKQVTKSNNRISLAAYTAVNNQKEAMNFLKNNGGTKPTSYTDFTCQLQNLIDNGGETLLVEFAKLHPDRDLILASASQKEYENACGCAFAAADGDENQPQARKPYISPPVTNALMIVGILFLAFAGFKTIFK
jgi:hypothetical protein